MHIKRDGSVQGPLKAREIREIVASKFNKVSVNLALNFLYMYMCMLLDASQNNLTILHYSDCGGVYVIAWALMFFGVLVLQQNELVLVTASSQVNSL